MQCKSKMVIATTIEQEKQRNELWTAVMKQLKNRAARRIRINAKGQTFEISFWKLTPETRLKMKNKPYFTCDVRQEHFRVRHVVKTGEYYTTFQKERSSAHEKYTGEKPILDLDFVYANQYNPRGSRAWFAKSFDLRHVKYGKSAKGTTNKQNPNEPFRGLYDIKYLKEMCKMNAIKVPAAAKYEDIVALLKTLP
jgi:hypothetical protein